MENGTLAEATVCAIWSESAKSRYQSAFGSWMGRTPGGSDPMPLAAWAVTKRLAGAADQGDRPVRQSLAAIGERDGRVRPGGDVPGEDPRDRLPCQVQVVDLVAPGVAHVVHHRDGPGDVRHVLIPARQRAVSAAPGGLEGADLCFGASEVHRLVAVLIHTGR
jgi:hypothetical protein